MDEILDYYFLCDRLRELLFDYCKLKKTLHNDELAIEYEKFLNSFRELYRNSINLRKQIEKYDYNEDT